MARSSEPKRSSNEGRVLTHPALKRQAPSQLLGRLWESWQAFAIENLRRLLIDLDDDLFARAESAESTIVQEMYFNSMRLLRYQADTIRKHFAEAISEASSSDRTSQGEVSEPQRGRLSLVDEEAFEQGLAISTIVQRFERSYALELQQAQRRIEALQHGLDSDSREGKIRFEVKRLAEAFAAALAPLDLDLRVRLVLFKHFDTEVVEPLGEWFRKLNEELIALGILPGLDLSAEARQKRLDEREQPAGGSHPAASPGKADAPQAPAAARPPSRSPRTAAQAPPFRGQEQDNYRGWEPDSYRGQEEDSFRGPAQGGFRDQEPAHLRGPEHSNPGKSNFVAPRPTLPPHFDPMLALQRRTTLMRKLPALKHRRRHSHAANPEQVLDFQTMLGLIEASGRNAIAAWEDSDLDHEPEHLDLAAHLIEEAQRAGRDQTALQDSDEDTVNLLQMLFDVILNDDQLAIPMRALIARLQLPMLRVALLDARFFAATAHPARRFLNAISRAGIGWSQANERSRDRLYAGIEILVKRASSEFKADPALFEQLRQELETLIEEEDERIAHAEEKVIAREQARIAADRTRSIVSRLVAHRLDSAPPLPASLEAFIKGEWQQVMMRAHGDPETWQSAFAVLRRLTGSQTGPEGSTLHSALKEGLAKLSETPAAANKTATEVVAILAKASLPAGHTPTATVPSIAPKPSEPEREADQVAKQAAEQAAKQAAEQAAKQAFEREAERAAAQAAEQANKEAVEREAEKASIQAARLSAEQEAEQAAKLTAEREAEQAAKLTAEREAEQAAKQAAEQEAKKEAEKAAEREAETANEQAAKLAAAREAERATQKSPEKPPEEELEQITAEIIEEVDARAAHQPGSDAMAAAEALVENTWVELRTRSDKLVRCRLAAITEAPERCIFLSRRGLRIETLSRLEIAQNIEAGRLRLLDDHQLFDRALTLVIDGLRAETSEAI